MTLEQFNQLSHDDALTQLLSCCQCVAWATQVAEQRPFDSIEALSGCAESSWAGVDTEQRLEAFAAHPLIGDVELLRERFANTARAEQGQVMAASEQTLNDLAELNVAYKDKHGFIFIICATGKSAEEMLDVLRQRLPNDTPTELDNAAVEQGKIMQLRLQQLWDIQ